MQRPGAAGDGAGLTPPPVRPCGTEGLKATGSRRASGPERAGSEPAAGTAQAGAGSPTPLRIPYGNKEVAFGMGARYGAEGWYAPPGVDLDAFRERGWL